MIASTFCQGNLRIVKVVYEHFAAILKDSNTLEHVKHRFDDLQRRVEGYEDGFRLLQARISNSIELVSTENKAAVTTNSESSSDIHETFV